MKCAVIRSERYGNGQVKRIESVRINELTITQAENLSEVATIVVLDATGLNGYATIYEDRETRQAIVDLAALESLALEHERRKVQNDCRNGWTS